MPLGIVLMGMVFNTLNALMQGGWIFYVSPADYYAGWFSQPFIYAGGALFLAGMAVNIHSDSIIRRLRRPGDTRHYIPRGGMFRYVSSANYFGDLVKRLTGKTAQEHIRLRLIDAAKERIADPARRSPRWPTNWDSNTPRTLPDSSRTWSVALPTGTETSTDALRNRLSGRLFRAVKW